MKEDDLTSFLLLICVFYVPVPYHLNCNMSLSNFVFGPASICGFIVRSGPPAHEVTLECWILLVGARINACDALTYKI